MGRTFSRSEDYQFHHIRISWYGWSESNRHALRALPSEDRKTTNSITPALFAHLTHWPVTNDGIPTVRAAAPLARPVLARSSELDLRSVAGIRTRCTSDRYTITKPRCSRDWRRPLNSCAFSFRLNTTSELCLDSTESSTPSGTNNLRRRTLRIDEAGYSNIAGPLRSTQWEFSPSTIRPSQVTRDYYHMNSVAEGTYLNRSISSAGTVSNSRSSSRTVMPSRNS